MAESQQQVTRPNLEGEAVQMSSRENSIVAQSCIDYERPDKRNAVGLASSLVERPNPGQRSQRADSKLRQLLENVHGSTSKTTEVIPDPA